MKKMYSTILLAMLMSMVGARVFATGSTHLDGFVSLIDNGDMEGDDTWNFAKRENFGPIDHDVITDGVGVDGSRGVKVVSVGGQDGSWATQFYVISNEVLYEGDKIHVSFDYRAEGGGVGVTALSQAHFDPGDYHHWDVIGAPTFTADWQTYDKTIVINASMAGTNGLKTIAFSLSDNTTDGAYYFDNVVFEIEKENQQQGIKINEENFPDAGFRNYLRSQSYGEDGILTEDEINGITDMTVAFKGISSLQGIEYFTALTYLHCGSNYLTSLDVSKNTALDWLICDNNRLTSLDVSGSTALTHLSCPRNPLTSLDASGCTALTWLECPDNQLTSLDVSGCAALTTLRCYNNQLTSLDVSGCTALTDLVCPDNQLTSLNVSGCTALTSLFCSSNQLTSLDVSGCTALTTLACYENPLTSLDVSGCTALTSLSCFSNQLTSLDVSKNTALKSLHCYSNQIKGEAMDALISSLPQNMTDEIYTFGVYNVDNPDEGNVCTKTQVAAAKAKGWTPHYLKDNQYLEYEGSADSIEPIEETTETTFSDEMDEDTDLSDTVIDNTYYNMDADNGDGYDATEQAIVLNSTTTDEQMEAIQNASVGDDVISENFNGIIIEVPAGSGTVTVDVKTIGTHVLNVKVGSEQPKKITKSERGTVDVTYNVTEPTYVYIYASTEESSANRAAAANSVLLYGYKVTLGATDIRLIDLSKHADVYDLRGNKVRSEATTLSGLPAGIYVINGKKVVVK